MGRRFDVAVGLVLLAGGLLLGTRPIIASDMITSREPPHAQVRRDKNCGRVFAPKCDLMRFAARRAMFTLLVAASGVAVMAAGLTRVFTQHQGDPWTRSEALGYVAAPTLLIGFALALFAYTIYVGVAFPAGD